jgi:hypothetical protein
MGVCEVFNELVRGWFSFAAGASEELKLLLDCSFCFRLLEILERIMLESNESPFTY